MLLLREKVVTSDGMLEIELHDDLRYRLSWRGIVYDNKRRYDFKSVEQLRYDNVVSDDAKREGRTLEGLGIDPVAMAAVVPSYLWRFRRTGQFNRRVTS